MLLGLGLGFCATALEMIARERRQRLARGTKTVTQNALERLGVPARSRYILVNDLRLHVIEAGPTNGPLAVLLHGFPECWYAWHKQIPALAQGGYHVIAPDQRGYNLSEKPAGVENYSGERLAGDVRDLIKVFGYESATIIGHDWGGVVAWNFGMAYREMVDKLIILNAPHPAAYRRELRNNPNQRAKSWYVLFFQIPILPEISLGASPANSARFFFRPTTVRKGAFSDQDLEVLAIALAQPGAPRAMINWYRAAFREEIKRGFNSPKESRSIQAPSLLIWAENDVALEKSLTYDLAGWVPDLKVHYIPDCGHWVQHKAPGEVNEEILSFLKSNE